jgi:hypothetical protein
MILFSLLRIFADNQDKRAVCFFWVVFLIVIVAIVIAANFCNYYRLL